MIVDTLRKTYLSASYMKTLARTDSDEMEVASICNIWASNPYEFLIFWYFIVVFILMTTLYQLIYQTPNDSTHNLKYCK